MIQAVWGALVDFFWNLVDVLQTYNGAVTAVATIFIGIFTCVLAYVTRRQAILTRESINLARDEFNATHRPHLVVRDVVRNGDEILYLLVNKGGATATIVESRVLLEAPESPDAVRPLRSAEHDELGRMVLLPGEARDLCFGLDLPQSLLLPLLKRKRDGPTLTRGEPTGAERISQAPLFMRVQTAAVGAPFSAAFGMAAALTGQRTPPTSTKISV